MKTPKTIDVCLLLLPNNVCKRVFMKIIIVANVDNKKLSCRRETARRFLSLDILLSHSRSFKTTLLSRACVSPY